MSVVVRGIMGNIGEDTLCSYEELMADLERGKWEKAMVDEMNQIGEKKVVELVQRATKCKRIKNKWLLYWNVYGGWHCTESTDGIRCPFHFI